MMTVRCPHCQTKLKIDEQNLKGEILKFRCPKCSSVLRAKNPTPTVVLPPEPKPIPPQPEVEKKPAAPQDEEKKGPPKTPPRAFKRVPFKEKVLVDNAIMVNTIDISEGGLFVHTGRSFVVDSIVDVSLPMGEGKLIVKATVQHNQPGIGMGLQFTELSAVQRNKLQRMIAALDAENQNKNISRKTILLAGGSETARRISKSKLVLEGFYVLEARTDKEVFASFENQLPDVIVLDWEDQQVKGPEVLAKVKKNVKWGKITMVVLSGVSNEETQRRALDAGADTFLAKMDTPPVKLADKLKGLVG